VVPSTDLYLLGLSISLSLSLSLSFSLCFSYSSSLLPTLSFPPSRSHARACALSLCDDEDLMSQDEPHASHQKSQHMHECGMGFMRMSHGTCKMWGKDLTLQDVLNFYIFHDSFRCAPFHIHTCAVNYW